ncbi:MAG: hypothetical protein QGF00_24380 [Planctomycetota bacterium]|nr:hypothetical protein [Planctomycetota bacterium]
MTRTRIVNGFNACALCAVVVFSARTQPVRASEADLRMSRSEETFEVVNEFAQDTPTVYIVGITDRKAKPRRHTSGVTLNGLRLSEKMLSRAVLILRPDGTGSWGYDGGDEPHQTDWPAKDPEVRFRDQDKLTLDRVSGAYPIEFPHPVKMTALKVMAGYEAVTGDGNELTIGLYEDIEATRPIAVQKVTGDRKFPVTFTGLSVSKAFLRFKRSGKGRRWLYRTRLSADLNTTGLKLPLLKHGKNAFTITDDPGSSHRTRVVLKWLDRPSGESIACDFEGKKIFTRGSKYCALPDPKERPFTGAGCAVVRMPADTGPSGIVLHGSLGGADWSKYNTLVLATRRLGRLHPGHAVAQLMFRNQGEKRYRPIWLKGTARWSQTRYDISGIPRDKLAAIAVNIWIRKGAFRPGTFFELMIDTMQLVEEKVGPRKSALPDHVRSFRLPGNQVPPELEPQSLESFFPLGAYAGPMMEGREYALHLMKKHNMNTWYLNNASPAYLKDALPAAERNGIRIIYQGGSPGALCFLPRRDAENTKQMFLKEIVPNAKKYIPSFAGRGGLLAWSLGEEVQPWCVPLLTDYYALVRKLDPTHPPVFLHNNIGSAESDAVTNHPQAMTYDFYPFFLNPWHGPTNYRSARAMFLGRMERFYRAARKGGSLFWAMPQCVGMEPTADQATLDPPHYGRHPGGYKLPTPAEIRWQTYATVAIGAKGVMFYHYDSLLGPEMAGNENLTEMGKVFGEIKRLSPVLLRLERDDTEREWVACNDSLIFVRSFRPQKGSSLEGRFLMVVNNDMRNERTFALGLKGEPSDAFDLRAGKKITGQLQNITLAPGDGMLVLMGSEKSFQTIQGDNE